MAEQVLGANHRPRQLCTATLHVSSTIIQTHVLSGSNYEHSHSALLWWMIYVEWSDLAAAWLTSFGTFTRLLRPCFDLQPPRHKARPAI
jgi:hypothetical protein